MEFCVILLSTARKLRNGTCIYATARPVHNMYKSIKKKIILYFDVNSTKIPHGADSRNTIQNGLHEGPIRLEIMSSMSTP
jgi:hypothetical protein